MRAMILAAGLGTRLRPLTLVCPKPLLPIANRPLILHHLELLKAAGVREVAINLHHLPEALPAALGDGSALGIRITWSFEPVVLETGGGVRQLAGFLEAPGEPFFLLNGDALIEVSLEAVLATHRTRGALATMVLREDPEAERYGALGVDASDRIIDFIGRARAPGEVVRRGLFTGIHVLEPAVIALIPEGPCGINLTAYPRMVREGMRVQAHFQQGGWFDVGTPERYLEANLAVLERRFTLAGPSPFEAAAFASDGTRVFGAPGRVGGLERARVSGPFVMGEGVSLDAGAEVGPLVCLGEGVEVGAGAVVRRSVVLPGARIEAGARLEGALAWREGTMTRVLDVSSG